MKKILLLVILSISAFAANAGGVRSLDMKANLRHDFGLGLGVTFELPKNFEIAPSLKLLLQRRKHAHYRPGFPLPF